jgi:predicted outer membrane repeat protein
MNWKNLIWNRQIHPKKKKCKAIHKFQNNSATTSGGGLYVSSSSKNSDGYWVQDVIENVVFERNHAGWSGELKFCFLGRPQEPSGP